MDAAMPHRTYNDAADQHATGDQRTYVTLTHLAGLLSVLDIGLFISPLATALLWQIKKGESHWMDDHLKEAMNFQISLLFWGLIGVLVAILSIGLLAIPIMIALYALRVIGCVRAAIYANKGRYHRYPACWRVFH